MNIYDAHISGSLSVSSSAEISGDLTVLGLLNANVSGTITNAVTAAYAPNYTLTSSFEDFTSSYTTGSFTGSFTGSMKGDGSGLTNIPAGSIVGLNLSRIASGGATASISPVNGFRVNTNAEVTGTLSVTGNIIGAADFNTLRNLPTLVSGSSQLTGSYDQRYVISGSITQTTWDNIANKPTGIVSGSVQVVLTGVTGYSDFSSSINDLSASLTTTDNGLSSSIGGLSSSVATTTSGLSSSIGSLSSSVATTDSAQNGRLNAIQTATSSLESFTSSIATTIKNKLNTEGVVSGSIQVNITGTTGYSTFSSSISSSIGSLSGSVAQTTLDLSSSLDTFEGSISSSLGSLSSSVATTTSGLSSSIGSLSSSVATTTLGLSSSINSISGAVATTTSNLSSSIGSLSSSVAVTDLGIKNRLGAIETSTGSLNSFTSSINTTIDSELNVKNVISGSIQVVLTGTTGYSTFSSSVSSSIANLSSSIAVTDSAQNGRLTALESTSASLNTYTSSNNSRLSGIEATTGSLNSYTSSAKAKFISIETSTGSLNTFTSSASGRLDSLETASGSIRTNFNSYTSSANGRLTSLEGASGSIRTNFNTYTSSNDDRVNAIEISTGSLNSFTSSIASTIKTKLNTEGVVSGSSQVLITGTTGYSTFSSSISTSIGSLSSSVSTSIGALSASNATYNNTQDNRMGALEISTGSLNSFTSSIATTIKNKLNTETVISGSVQVDITQTTNYTSFSSSIATTDANQNSRLNAIEGVSGSYATTGSNRFVGNQIITGSVTISENLLVLGSSSITYVTASQLAVSSSIISVNVFEPSERFGGLKIYDSGSSNATASFLWDSQNNRFVYQNEVSASYHGAMFIAGPRNSGSLGDEPSLTYGRIPKSIGGDHIDNSIMSEVSGSIGISGSLVITGSILSTGTSLVSGSSQIDITATTNYTTFSSSVSSSIGALSSSVATTDANQNTRLNALESTTASLNTATSSALTRLTSIESTTASLNSYTSSNTGNITLIQTATASLNSYTSSANTRFGTIESTTGSLNTFTGSANTRLNLLETASGSIRSAFNNYTSSNDTRVSALETASSSIRSDFNSYTSSANGRLDSIESKTGSITSLNNYTGSNNTVIGTLQSTTASLNSYTSSNTTNINAIHTATSSLNTYTSSANTRFGTIESTTASLNTYTSSANTRFSGIETTTGSLNTFTGSANSRLNSLESASGSIRTDFNSYTSSANGRLNSIEGVTGSISTLNTYTGSANSRLSSLETTSGSVNTAISGLNTYSASLKSVNLISGSAQLTSSFVQKTGDTMSGQFIVGSTGLAGSATVKINNSSASTFNHSIEAFTANMTAGQTNIIVVGQGGSTKNSGYLGYNWSSSASNSNYVSLGHWGNDNLFRIYADGTVYMGTVTTGVWNGTAIGDSYISSATSWNTAYNKRISSLGFTSSTVTITLADTTTVTASVPTFNQNTTGTAANITASSNTSLTSIANLATVGTITSGTWNGTAIGDTYISSATSWNTAYNKRLSSAGLTSSTLTLTLADSSTVTASVPTFNQNTTGYARSLGGFSDQTEYTIITGPANGPTWKVRWDSATTNRYADLGFINNAGTFTSGLKLTDSSTLTWLGYTVYHSNNVPTWNQNTTGTAANITATSNSTLTTLSALSLPYSQLSGTVPTWNQSTTGNAATASQLTVSLSGTNASNIIYATIADNDFFRLRVGGDAANAGWAELATADDGTEPIYVRQYTGTFTTLIRTATLLDGSGNTTFPGTVTASSFSGAGTGLTGTASSLTAGAANSVAWTNVSGRPTAVSSFSNDSGFQTSSGTVTNSYYMYLNGGQSGAVTINEGRTGVYRTESGSGGTFSYAPVLHVGGGDTMWQIQGSYGSSGTGNIQWRQGYQGSFGSWVTILHSSNYGGYSVFSGNVTVPLNSSSGFASANNAAWFRPTDPSGNTHVYNNNGGGIYLDTNANHYFRNTAGTNRLVIDTSGNATLTGVFTENSSLRYKKDIETIKYGLDKVLQMRGVTYVKKDNDVKEIGVIAEEMYEILPDVVLKNDEGIVDSVSYGRITAVLIEAIKDLKQEINEQNLIISELKSKLD